MEHLLQFGLSNAVAAAVLAVLAAIATRVWKNPYFAYALWLVVLLRLVAPPLLPIALPVPAWLAVNSSEPLPAQRESERELRPPVEVPSSAARTTGLRRTHWNGYPQSSRGPQSGHGGPVAPERTRLATLPTAPLVGHKSELLDRTPLHQDRGNPEVARPRGLSGLSQNESNDVSPAVSKPVPKTVATAVSPSSAFRWPSIAILVAAVWLSGTLCYLLLTFLRVRRFGRMLRQARRDVPAEVAAQAVEVATAVGLRRVPQLAFAKAALPPMVWPGRRSVVLLPEALFSSLGAGERRLLLWHEFLHLRRRDHLVRWFEVFVVGLYWWNPVAWWAVARLQRAEEDCCDAAVLVAHPHESARYGETLVSVAQFLSAGTLPTPSLSVGVARNGHIKRRLTMILNGPRWPELSKTRLAAFCLLGAALVAVTWTAAKAQVSPAAPAASPSVSPKTEETHVADGLAKPRDEREDLQIDEILVEGNVRIPSATILQTMKIQAGRKVPQSQIEEGSNALMKTRQFYSAIPTFRFTDKKTTLILRVLERPLLRNVSYLGAQIEMPFETKRLAAVTRLTIGDPYSILDNKQAARRLEEFYRKHGYPEATVELLRGDKPEHRDVIFAIDEGHTQKAVWRYFVGNESVSSERLAKELKSSPADAGKLDRMNLAEDAAALRKYYASVGFRNAVVTPVVLHSKDRKWIYIQYTVQEGLPYQPVMGIDRDAKAADKSPASSSLEPTVPVPEKRDVRLSQIAEMQPAPGDDELRKLQKERFNAALRELKLYEYQYEAGTTRASDVCKATRNLFDTWMALAQRPAERLRAVDWYVGYTNRLWNEAHARLATGDVAGFNPVDEPEARAAHFEAEIEAMKLRQRLASKIGVEKARELEQATAAHKHSTASPKETPFPASDKNALNQRENQPQAGTGGTVRAAAKSEPTAHKGSPVPLPALLSRHPLQPQPQDDERHRLLKERYNAALRLLQASYRRHEIDPTVTATNVIAAARRLLAADLALMDDPVAVRERHLEFMKYLEREAEARFEAHLVGRDELEAAHEARLDAELELLEAKTGKAAPVKPPDPPAT